MSELSSDQTLPDQTTEPPPKYVANGKRFVAFATPQLEPPQFVRDKYSHEQVGAKIECPMLREKHDKATVDSLMGRLMESYSGGSSITHLFRQESEEGIGMSLLHAWFGANMRVYAHSHPAHGDCLYYVVAGEAVMGAKRLGPGSVLFVPKGKSYKVIAGPIGLEFLEFRVGNPDPNKSDQSVDERTIESVEELIEINEMNKANWQQPEHIGDLAFLQKEYDAQQGELA